MFQDDENFHSFIGTAHYAFPGWISGVRIRLYPDNGIQRSLPEHQGQS